MSVVGDHRLAPVDRPVLHHPQPGAVVSWTANNRVLDAAADLGPLLGASSSARSSPRTSTSSSWFVWRACSTRSSRRVNVARADSAARHSEALADVREHVHRRQPRSRRSGARSSCRRWPPGIVVGTVDDATRACRASRKVRAPDLSGADPARSRPASRSRTSRGSRCRSGSRYVTGYGRAFPRGVKVPEHCRFVSIGDRGLVMPIRGVISHFLSWVFPGMDRDRAGGVSAHPRRRHRISDDADDLLGAVEASCASAGSARSCGSRSRSSISHAMVRAVGAPRRQAGLLYRYTGSRSARRDAAS
jgi:hypothetical protein